MIGWVRYLINGFHISVTTVSYDKYLTEQNSPPYSAMYNPSNFMRNAQEITAWASIKVLLV